MGKCAWSILAIAVMLQVFSIAWFVKSLNTESSLDGTIIAAVIQLLAIFFFGIFRYAIQVYMLDKAGGPDAYLAQKVDWPNDSTYTGIVDNCGVRKEFDAWYDKQAGKISIGEFDNALRSVISSTYSLPPETPLSDSRLLRIVIIKYSDAVLKWLCVGCLLFAVLSILLLFNASNTFKEGYPFIVLPISLAVMFHYLRRVVTVKKTALILERPLTSGEIDGLMRLASGLNLHPAFCELMRSPSRPVTVKDAHAWLMNRAERSETFLG